MHKKLQCFYFYDVLTILARYTCEMKHPMIKKRRIDFKINIMVDRILSFK